jgi:hypothetical protein
MTFALWDLVMQEIGLFLDPIARIQIKLAFPMSISEYRASCALSFISTAGSPLLLQ